MIELERVFKPPKPPHPMVKLDRDLFTSNIPLVLAVLGNVSFISQLNRAVPGDLLQVQGISRIINLDNGKGVLLKHQISSVDQVDQMISESAKELFKQAQTSFVPYSLKLDYNYWKTDEILSQVIPQSLLDSEGGAPPSGYTAVGHVAHMNLRDEFQPYKKLIGQVILDKSPSIRTVVNKLDSIDTVYRTFDMEVLAGDDDFIVEQSESGCKFRFDFSKVYWNSRLHTEHDRLIQQFKPGQAIGDVFAGVGPFAIPAGKKRAIVLANDLNPESYKSLVENIALNKTQKTVVPLNMDGRDFIRQSVRLLLEYQETNPLIEIPVKQSRSNSNTNKKVKTASNPQIITIPKTFSHYVMNLPDTAITFLDAFIGLYSDSEIRKQIFGDKSLSSEDMPFIHVHCFYKWDPHSPEPELQDIYESLRQRCAKAMNYDNLNINDMSFHKVRRVAPTKTMFCISFRLPLEVALASTTIT